MMQRLANKRHFFDRNDDPETCQLLLKMLLSLMKAAMLAACEDERVKCERRKRIPGYESIDCLLINAIPLAAIMAISLNGYAERLAVYQQQQHQGKRIQSSAAIRPIILPPSGLNMIYAIFTEPYNNVCAAVIAGTAIWNKFHQQQQRLPIYLSTTFVRPPNYTSIIKPYPWQSVIVVEYTFWASFAYIRRVIMNF